MADIGAAGTMPVADAVPLPFAGAPRNTAPFFEFSACRRAILTAGPELSKEIRQRHRIEMRLPQHDRAEGIGLSLICSRVLQHQGAGANLNAALRHAAQAATQASGNGADDVRNT